MVELSKTKQLYSTKNFITSRKKNLILGDLHKAFLAANRAWKECPNDITLKKMLTRLKHRIEYLSVQVELLGEIEDAN